MTASAQKRFYDLSNDTIKADTNYYPSSAGFEVPTSGGLVIFEFTHTDVADSLAAARLEGYIGTSWVALTGTGALSLTTTDGTSRIYVSTPLPYLKYRAWLSCASGDTVAITNPFLMLKEE